MIRPSTTRLRQRQQYLPPIFTLALIGISPIACNLTPSGPL